MSSRAVRSRSVRIMRSGHRGGAHPTAQATAGDRRGTEGRAGRGEDRCRIGKSHTRRARISGSTLVVLAMVAAACGGGGAPESSAGKSEGGTGKREFATFASEMYSYTIGYPTTWYVRAATRPILANEFPFFTSRAVDRFGESEATRLDSPQVLVSAREVSVGTSLADWTDDTIELASGQPLCEESSPQSIELAGEPAALMTLCRGETFFDIWAVAVHDGFGYQVIWIGPPRNEEEGRALFDEILKTFAFTS
jgi:hypothetical protein